MPTLCRLPGVWVHNLLLKKRRNIILKVRPHWDTHLSLIVSKSGRSVEWIRRTHLLHHHLRYLRLYENHVPVLIIEY